MSAPKLRFKEFDGDWSLKKLGDLSFKPQYGMNSSATEFDGENKYLRITDINEDDHSFNFSKLTSPDDDLDDKYLLKKGDLLFARTGASVGKSYLYNSKDGKVYFAGFLIKFSLQKDVNPYFVFSQTLSKKFQNWVITNSMRSGQPGINAEEYSLLPISFTSLEEQTKIASFLSQVDEKIQQLNQKHELLNQYKQGMMQKLFSQQILFKADDGSEFGEWEETTLGKVAEIIGGGTPSTDNEDYWNGNIVWLTPSEINKKFISESKRTISELGVQKSSAKKLPIGTILFTSRATIGEVSIAMQEVTTNQGFQSFLTNSNTFNEFLYYWIIQNKKKFIERASGSTFLEISKSKIQPMKLLLPCLEEQTKIANFLSAIDQKIEVVAQQIEQTKQWKKGLLQQMFV
ncbi:restriction endonuclease subunit S [Acinetobacter sp. CFCC 10889]|uniref:restriction endonuclease subunit S n=1 Tax=Acinetobacter sp. CFCC 10889 TaxID=1775557 RepID=UPI000DD076C3|nr:restriction endonuclease subunit S [Acinetobacter sp. CFCC 10889]